MIKHFRRVHRRWTLPAANYGVLCAKLISIVRIDHVGRAQGGKPSPPFALAAIKTTLEATWYPPSPSSEVPTFLCVYFSPHPLSVANNPNITGRLFCISMVAFSIRASLVLASLLVPAAFAAPAGTNTIATPFGEYPVANVYAGPEGNGS